jgi:LysR family hydrogen peroxide-inducible transcriptional activator
MKAPDVSLRQLQYVVAVADHGGFRRAAEACHVSQPALSAQVALAEKQLGVQIFERDRRSVRLSAAGHDVVAHARRLLVAAAELQDLSRRLSDPLQGTVRLGIIPTIGPYLLPEITPALARAFPKLTLHWREQQTHELVRVLRAGELDAILVARESSLGELEWIPLGRDAFVIAANPAHPLVKPKTPAHPDALGGTRMLLLDDGHCLRDQALSVCAKAGAMEESFRATSLATLVQMVSSSDAVTLLPSMAVPVENRRAQLRVRCFAGNGPARTLGFAYRKGSSIGPTLEALATVIRTRLAAQGSGPSAVSR